MLASSSVAEPVNQTIVSGDRMSNARKTDRALTKLAYVEDDDALRARRPESGFGFQRLQSAASVVGGIWNGVWWDMSHAVPLFASVVPLVLHL